MDFVMNFTVMSRKSIQSTFIAEYTIRKKRSKASLS